MWFENLTGFVEESPEVVRSNITVDGIKLRSHVNGKQLICGELETPSLAELRERVQSCTYNRGGASVREVVANVQDLHTNEENAGCLFQVASQFNLLEMMSPYVSPEEGVGIYERDPTQGPACAIAAGAGTIYRNYFATVNGGIGQTATNQIDCLYDLGTAMGNSDGHLWCMKNGYALATLEGLDEIADRLRLANATEVDRLRGLLRIGIQWNTQVTLKGCRHLVSQAYCSALPVAYSHHSPRSWDVFAKLVLEAAYEATICVAVLNAQRTGNIKVFLTLLGGGAFGNETQWITRAIQHALQQCLVHRLDVAIVSYGASNPDVQQLISSM